MKSLEEIHKNCHKIFLEGFFDEPEEATDKDMYLFEFSLGQSRACKIYHKLTEGEERSEDCIGENFNQLILKIHNNWFENYKPTGDIDFYFINYFLLLYLFTERVELIFNIINPGGNSKLFKDFRHNNFPTLRKISKWANFIKHPKEFLFTHWAKYYYEGDSEMALKPGDVKIDTDFIFNH